MPIDAGWRCGAWAAMVQVVVQLVVALLASLVAHGAALADGTGSQVLPCPAGTHREGRLCIAGPMPPRQPPPSVEGSDDQPLKRPPFAAPASDERRMERPQQGNDPRLGKPPVAPKRRGLERAAPRDRPDYRTMPGYGGKVRRMDLIALVTTPLFGIGIAVYVFGSPILHLAKAGSGGRALCSFALRVVLPVTGIVIGSELNNDGATLVLGVTGLVAASLIDANVFAGPYEVPHPVPIITATSSGTPIFGLGGRF